MQLRSWGECEIEKCGKHSRIQLPPQRYCKPNHTQNTSNLSGICTGFNERRNLLQIWTHTYILIKTKSETSKYTGSYIKLQCKPQNVGKRTTQWSFPFSTSWLSSLKCLRNTNFTKSQQNLNFNTQFPINEQSNQNPDRQFQKFHISNQNSAYNLKPQNQNENKN